MRPAAAPLLPSEAFLEAVRIRNPLHIKYARAAYARLRPEEATRLDRYMAFCRHQGLTLDDVAESYLTVVGDTLREQAYFRKHRQYRHSRFADVAQSVYFNDSYMAKYMYGLAISAFLWPNHLDILRFFRETLPRGERGRYLEIGPGHGYFLTTAMEEGDYDHVLGVDISRASIEQTRAIIAYFSPELASRTQLLEADFLTCELSPGFDAIVMGEVLEHVEEPAAFLARIRDLASDSAYIFVTTCLNAPAIDHITQFRNPTELDVLFASNSLHVRRALLRPYEGKSLAESLAQELPVNVAYVLAKAPT